MERRVVFEGHSSFDHYAISVTDLERSLSFYVNFLGLHTKARPEFDFNGAWLTLDDKTEIHLIENKNTSFELSSSRALHFAFKHPNLKKVVSLCEVNSVQFKPIKMRPDGIYQLFIKDPDGYWIELCEK
ncbi:MAG: hypothetical protein RLZZ546_2211 [Bacteroidota bacterium]